LESSTSTPPIAYGRLIPALNRTGISTGDYTLGDLLVDLEELGLELVVAPEGWEKKAITGAHSIEVDHPAAWLDRDWVMLTTGMHLPPKAAAQRQLVDELDEVGVAALGFGLDVVHREIPKAILKAAQARGLPIFTIPLRTAFRDVISAVFRATLSSELRSSTRLAAMQRFLMDALGEESPRSTVLQRLGSLIEATVAIVTAQGKVLASTRDVQGQAIASALHGVSAASTRFEVEDLRGAAFAIDEPSATEAHWLVIVAPAGRALHPLTRPAAQSTLPLLTAMARLDERHQLQEAAVRQATLETLLDVDDRNDAAVAAARAAAAGFDVAEGVQAIVAMDPANETDMMQLLPLAARAFPDAQAPSLATVREGMLVIVARAPIADEMIVKRLLPDNPRLRVGIGRSVTEPWAVRRSWADAELALRAAVRREPQSIVRYEELDFRSVLLNELPLDRLRPKMEAWLAPLYENPLVLEAVRAYLRYDLDVGRTARSLRLHPNSVRYRLSRAEDLIGARLRSPETIVALHVSLLNTDIEPAPPSHP
jgi:PucR family transcriptional regulator, purine catabolism regulatory protein